MSEQKDTQERLTFWVTMLVTITLCLIVSSMVGAFLYGLYIKQMDHHEIFKMLSPAFSTLIGGMIGFLSGIKLTANEDKK